MITIVELQLLNYVLAKKDMSVLTDNNIDGDYFPEYANEYKFIKEHYDEYKTVPDVETFMAEFDDFSLLEVSESEPLRALNRSF